MKFTSPGEFAQECAEAIYRACGAPENITFPILVSLVEEVRERDAEANAQLLAAMAEGQ